MNTKTDTTTDDVIDGDKGAITEVKAPDNALVVTNPEQYAKELFESFHTRLATAKRKAARVTYDITTKAGMEQAKELRTLFQKIRTEADKLKTERKRPIDQAGKAILAGYNTVEAAAKAEEAKHDKAIKDEEARLEAERQRKLEEERVRIEAIENRIANIRSLSETLAGADSATIEVAIQKWSTMRLEPGDYEEFLEQALTALNTTVDALRVLHEAALAREAEQRRIEAERAELARLKEEAAKREAAEREAAAERERAAQAEREAAAAREADLKRQLAEMQAQLAASRPQPAAAPIEEAKPAPINSTGQYYSETTFRDDGKPILCNADGTRSIFCDVDQGGEQGGEQQEAAATVADSALEPEAWRPTDGDIVKVLAAHYDESAEKITIWLREFAL